MKKIKLNFIAAALLAVLGVVGGVAVYADTSSTIVVSPMTQDVILQPGEKYIGSIKVSNPNDAEDDMTYSVSVGSFSQVASEGNVDDYAQVDTETKTAYNQMVDWITLDEDEGVVAPNETDVISFTINVPETAPAGGQYATILVQNETDKGSSDGNVEIKSKVQVASIIYAEVAGETHEYGEITENDMPGLLLSNTLEATSMVKNNGNIHTDAEYTLQVWPLFSDEEICTNAEKPDLSLVMPETERYYTQTCELPAVGIFNAKQVVKIFGEESVIEKTILVCPVWLLLIILFVIALIVIWIVVRVRNCGKTAKRSGATKVAE